MHQSCQTGIKFSDCLYLDASCWRILSGSARGCAIYPPTPSPDTTQLLLRLFVRRSRWWRARGPSAMEIHDRQDQALDDKGREYMRQGDYEEALNYFQKAYDDSEYEMYAKGYRKDIAWAKNCIAYDAVNKQANNAWEAHDWVETLRLLKEQQKLRNGPNVRRDISTIKKKIADQQREAKEQALADRKATDQQIAIAQQNRIATEKIQQDTQNFTQSLRAAPSSSGLDFSAGEPGNNAGESSGLAFTASEPVPPDKPVPQSAGSGTGIFGTTSNPSNPGLVGLSSDAIPTHSASGQASSASKSGKDAVTARTPEEAKGLSNCQFDTMGCRKPDTIQIPRPAQTPGTVELANHIPKEVLKNDPVIQQSMAYYQKLDGEELSTKTKLAAVQKQINDGTGDSEVLDAQKATLTNDLKRYDTDQANTEAQIKERLKSIHVAWVESSATGSDASTKTTP